MLSINNLHVDSIDNENILRGVSLRVGKNEKHIVVGPNGSGKSTLAKIIMGHPDYRVSKGQIIFNNKDIIHASTDKRARLGLFLSFQSPIEIPGVTYKDLLRVTSMREITDEELNRQAEKLKLHKDLSNCSLNCNFSGGEKKKSEIIQLAMLRPKAAILDEPDSGLDIDALKQVAESINSFKHLHSLILITHNQNILDYISPDYIHVMKEGRIIKTGQKELLHEIQKYGYDKL